MKKFFSFVAAVIFAGSMMAATSMTCAEAAAAALSVSANNEEYNNGEEIEVVGYVTNIAFSWKEGTMSFWMADDSLETSNVLEAYKVAIANEADAPKVTDKVKVTGKLTKYNTTPEFAAGCTCEILQVGTGAAVVVIDVTNCATAAQAALSVSANNEPYNDSTVYTVTGYVTSIANAWANGTMTFWMADAADGGNVLEAFKCAIANQTDAPNVGDKVSVTGVLTKYNTTPEFAAGCTCVVLEKSDAPKNLGEKTIAEFLALKNKKDTCILHGTIANLPEDKTVNAWVYGNFDLVDATDSIYIYGLLTPEGQNKQFASMGLENGSEITIKAIYTEYNGNPQVANAILVVNEGDLEQLNVAQACDVALALGDNETTGQSYAVHGYVAKITETYSEEYKNISFYMTDDATSTYGDLQIRRAKISAEEGAALAAGDRVMVIGKLTNNFYNNKNTPQIYQGQASVEWKAAIENIILTEKVDKVIVDGVLYIVRDGKLFNLQGAQVR